MNSPHWPLFGFGCLAFVLICTVIAIALFFIFKSGEKGSTKLGGCAGAAIGCALVFVACLAALFVFFVAAATAKSELVKNGPVKSFEFELEPDSRPPAPPGMPGQARPDRQGLDRQGLAPHTLAVLRVELRGGADANDISNRVTDWLRDNTDGQIAVHSQRVDKNGVTTLEFGVDVDQGQLDDLRRGLRQAVPGWRLPKRAKVEIKNE
jgi:hypothetical protein